MKIYGVAVLAACFIAGQLIGDVLGMVFKFDGNIGGVGFGMLLLILFGDAMKKKNWIDTEAESGIHFWSGMYIPVVVAMSSIQNVKAALSGGWVALVVGVVATGFCFMLIPLLSKFSPNTENQETWNN
ncbi:MAG: malonate transporter subunit MadL [Bacteroidota bacterium]|jgi:malonate transporter MadL subunit